MSGVQYIHTCMCTCVYTVRVDSIYMYSTFYVSSGGAGWGLCPYVPGNDNNAKVADRRGRSLTVKK